VRGRGYENLVFLANVTEEGKEIWRIPELQHKCCVALHKIQTKREENGDMQTYVSSSLPHPHFRSSSLAWECVISLSVLVVGCSQTFTSCI
jgi:hypothetical protein